MGDDIKTLLAEISTTGPWDTLMWDSLVKIARLTKACEIMAKALDFYECGKNLEIEPRGSLINWPSEEHHGDWRIGPPYLVSAEMGQTATAALTQATEALKGDL